MAEETSSYLKPSPFIERFARRLPKDESQTILEIGGCTGRNSAYLAKLGHTVIGFTNSHAEVKNIPLFVDIEGPGSLSFVVSDARRPAFKNGVFSVVIMNEVLHEMPKNDSRTVLKHVRDMTVPGGLNAISGYFNGGLSFPGDKGQYLGSHELEKEYDTPGWTILDYREDFPEGQEFGDKFLMNSLATIIARRDAF